MHRLRPLYWVSALVALGIVAGVAGSRAEGGAAVPADSARESPDARRLLGIFGRLHHAAEREVELGDLAEAGGARPETRRYGATLAGDFRAFDQRLLVAAAASGITPAQLDVAFHGENVPALERESDDLSHLANERGDRFDRDYWLAVSQEQSAAADMLVALAALPAAPLPLITEMSGLYGRASRGAIVAAQSVARPIAPAHEEAPVVASPPTATPSGPSASTKPAGPRSDVRSEARRPAVPFGGGVNPADVPTPPPLPSLDRPPPSGR